MRFILASLPAALIGLWNLGARAAETPLAADLWPIALLERSGAADQPPNVVTAVAIGGAFFLPLLAASFAVSRLWAEVFSRLRRRPLDDGWILWAWFFALLLPATVPIHFAMLGLSFGVVFGAHVFGGTGRYIVNPALLGLVFAAIAYPDLFAETRWVPGADEPSSWAAVAAAGVEASVAAGITFGELFLGREIGAPGATSALACLLGAAFLVARRSASLRVVVAGCAGFAAVAVLAGDLPWYWHFALGHFAFVLAFVATDPTIRPATRGGRWAFGALFGALTIVLRTANPEHPEGTWFALLLASLCIPLLDRIAMAGGTRLGRLEAAQEAPDGA